MKILLVFLGPAAVLGAIVGVWCVQKLRQAKHWDGE